MKVLLIQPPVRDFYQTSIRTQPIGLAYLAASLEQHGFDAEILDCQKTSQKKAIPVPAEFSYIQEWYPRGDLSPFRLHSGFFHFGLSYEEIAAHIRQSCADVIGISSQFTPYSKEAFAIARIAKSVNPSIPIIMGGAHVSAVPEHVLANPQVDYSVSGEAEQTLTLLLHTIKAGAMPDAVAGIGYKHNGAVHLNTQQRFIQDLDTLPFPARHLLDFSRYTIKSMAYTVLITSRGCPQGCTYCSVSRVMGKTFRPRSPENVLEEVKHCKETYGIRLFDIEDDNFALDQKRALQILHLLIEEFGEDELQLFAMNGLSIFSLNKALLKKMKQAGFHHLDLSLGSSSYLASTQMHRPHNPHKAAAVLRQAAAYSLPTTTYIIFGIPGHTLEDMLQSLQYLMGQHTLIGPSIFYPTPGTVVYEALYGVNPNPAPDYSALRSSLLPVETEEFSRLDLITLLRLSRWVNCIKQVILPELGRIEISLEQLQDTAENSWLSEELQVSDQNNFSFIRSVPLSTMEAGKILTGLFLKRKEFFWIKRLGLRKNKPYTYQISPHKTSQRVLMLFFNPDDSRTIHSTLQS